MPVVFLQKICYNTDIIRKAAATETNKGVHMKTGLKSAIAFLCCFCNLLSCIVFYPKAPQTDSVRFAQALGRGWNLGNTLESWQIPMPEDTETCWGNPKTTEALFALLKELGFTSVRIPVTWFQHMDEDYTIEPQWLDRVGEVVDYALNQGMYAILNVQHDDQDWLVANYENEEFAKAILAKVWSQISARFADYDEKLVFDVMNEPRVVGTETEWSGTPEVREVVNRLNETALEAIRSSGGKNETRYVLVTTCCASVEEDNCAALQVPSDERVIVSLHYYYGTAHRSEFEDCASRWTLSDYREIHKTLRRIHALFLQKGIGVCISEFGWTDRSHLNILTEKTKQFVRLVGNYGMSCLVWDNGADFRLIDRNALAAEFPDYVSAITENYPIRTYENVFGR